MHEYVSANASFHFVRAIKASTYAIDGAPLTLTLSGLKGMYAEINIFTYDQAFTDRLVKAINSVAVPTPDDYRD